MPCCTSEPGRDVVGVGLWQVVVIALGLYDSRTFFPLLVLSVVGAFVVLSFWLAIGRHGKRRLGDEPPEFARLDGVRDALLRELVGGQPRPLEQRAGLVGVDELQPVAGVQLTHEPQGGPPAGGGERAGPDRETLVDLEAAMLDTWYHVQDSNAESLAKTLATGFADPALVTQVTVLAALYIVSPIDFVPDSIPILGWLDDGARTALAEFSPQPMKNAAGLDVGQMVPVVSLVR